MNGIDLFSGAGGMSVGAQLSGVNLLASVENDYEAAETYKYNFKHSNIFCTDIRKITGKHFGIMNRKEPLIVFGGPPCQGFSTSNQKTRSSKNPRNWLFLEYVRIVEEVRPDWVVFENVRGILETEKGKFLKYVLDSLKQLGYYTNWKLLNAADYGVPQDRWRLFIVSSLKNIKFEFPSRTVNKLVTVHDAISDLPDLKNGANENKLPYKSNPKSKYAKEMRGKLKETTNHLLTKNAEHILERYRHVPQGGNWENIPENLMDNYRDRTRCHTGIYRRLRQDAPSVVIGNFRKNMLIHPLQNRGLSVREAARLQSFPDWFEFKGSIGFQQQQVGNAVPPLLAQAVFSKIAESI